MTQAPAVCANCSRPIGQLEPRAAWQNHVVCAECRDRLAASQTITYATPAPNDAISTLIPYRNSHALIAYYLGIFSIVPLAGIFMGVAAIILGVKGLHNARENPGVRGAVHAWVGILCGAIFGLLNLIFCGGGLISLIVSSFSR